MAKMVVEAVPREGGNKNEARRLRRSGRVPGVLYGANKPAVPVSLNPKQMKAVLESEAGQNTILEVNLDGDSASALIVDWQYEPVKGTLLHVDLKRIAMDQVLRVTVPVVARGEPAGVKTQGGILEYVHREVEVECLPSEIPEHIDADVTELLIGQNFRVKDLKIGPGVRMVTDKDEVLLHVITPKAEVAATAETAEAEAAPAEPEVIKKGKAEKEEEEPVEGGGAKKKEKEAGEGKKK